jgi:hypothetical protein
MEALRKSRLHLPMRAGEAVHAFATVRRTAPSRSSATRTKVLPPEQHDSSFNVSYPAVSAAAAIERG